MQSSTLIRRRSKFFLGAVGGCSPLSRWILVVAVCPNDQLGGVTLFEMTVLPSLVVTLKDSDRPLRYDPSFFLSNVVEDRLSKVKVFQWRITPPPIVARKCVIWWAKVCSCDNNGPCVTPFWITKTLDLKTRPARKTVVEKSGT